MEFMIGDKVKYKDGLTSGEHRQGQVGTITGVHKDLPAQAGVFVDIKFEVGEIDRGINTSQIEHA